MLPTKIQNIISKYLSNQASSAEIEMLEEWIEVEKNDIEFSQWVKANYLANYCLNKFDTKSSNKKLQNLIIREKRTFKRYRFKKIMRYAALFIILISSALFLRNYIGSSIKNEQEIVVNNIEPGTDKATLTLSDGSDIILESESNLKIKNATSDGQGIVYKKNNNTSSSIIYNYLTIPRGGQYFLQLSDGTKVWINSESKLKYPVSFIKGKPREVQLVYGEAYFDVSSSKNNGGTTFKVYQGNQEIQVLGTQFNVKAYNDESNIYTTLVEGKVALSFVDKDFALEPNQQSNINVLDNSVVTKVVDVYNEISWKDGIFSFEDKTLKEIMKVLSRWYDMDVVFKNKEIEDEAFVGVLGKDQSIQEILTNIKNFGVINDFEISNKKVEIK